jgi:DNA repair photolyase
MKTNVFGTKEWAKHNVNIQTGCPNDCRYCYAKSMALRFGRTTRESWKEPEINTNKVSKGYRKREGTIMFPTSHDITQDNLDECIAVLLKLLEAENKLLIVSKPDPGCIQELCCRLTEFKSQIKFRFTIGSAENDVLRFWEPGAPNFNHRLGALIIAYNRGFATSVSCEPMLDNRIENVVTAVLPYVTDAVWIGLPNKLALHIARNCGDEESKNRATELLANFTENRIHDLYDNYAGNSKIKWKESIKKIVGLELPKEVGLDI